LEFDVSLAFDNCLLVVVDYLMKYVEKLVLVS
jgi:hypothetical protein